MAWSLFLILAMPLFYTPQMMAQAPKNLTARELYQRVEEVMQSSSLSDFEVKALEGEYDHLSSLDNPRFSYGQGRVSNDLGLKADYNEFNISQNLSISGEKNRLEDIKGLAKEQALMRNEQADLTIVRQALSLAYGIKVQETKAEHIHERVARLHKVENFLKSRKFPSPQEKIVLELLKNKIESISVELTITDNTLKSLKRTLKAFLQYDQLPTIELKWLEVTKARALAEKITKQGSYEDRALTNEIMQLDRRYSIAKLAWVPDLTFYFNQSEEKYLGGNFNQTLGVGIEVPVFNVGQSVKESTLAKKKIKEIQRIRAQSMSSTEKDKILSGISSSIVIAQKYTLPFLDQKEEMIFRATREFDKGLINANHFLELEDQIHELHESRLQALQNIHLSLFYLIQKWGSRDNLKEIL